MQESQEPENSLVSQYPDVTGALIVAEKGRSGNAWIRSENPAELAEWR